jgi:hypothetical protein
MRSLSLSVAAFSTTAALAALVCPSGAAALESVWLVNGAKPAAEVETESSGKLVFEMAEFMGLKTKVTIVCTVHERGVVGGAKSVANPKWDETSKVTNELAGLPIICSFVHEEMGPCEAGFAPELEPLHVPWLTEMALSGAQYLDLIVGGGSGNPGWIMVCKVLGMLVKETCTTTKSEAELVNGVEGTVRVLYSKTLQPNLECTGSKAATESVAGEIEAHLGRAGTLAVSEG